MDKSTNQPATAEVVAAIWAVQDGLLHQYIVIFVTMQSIFLTFGGIAITRPNSVGLLLLISILVGVTMWMWLTVCPPRARSVLYCQALLLKTERGDPVFAPLKALKDFQSGARPELRLDADYLSLLDGGTKAGRKINKLLPWIFILVCALLWVLALLPLVKIEIKFITG